MNSGIFIPCIPFIPVEKDFGLSPWSEVNNQRTSNLDLGPAGLPAGFPSPGRL